MRNFKCSPMNMAMGEAVPFGQRYTYGSTHPMMAMLDPGYFLSMRHQLRAGDTVRLCQMEQIDIHGPGNRLLAYIDLIVIESSKEGIRFQRETDEPIYMPVPGEDNEGEPLPPVSSTYVDGDIKWCGMAGWAVVDEAGVKLATGIPDKDVAVKIAAGELPLPAEA